MAMASRMLIKSKQGQVTLNDLKVDVVCSYFGDRVLLVVTEVQKLGTLLEVTNDSVANTSSTNFSVRTLLGKDEADVHVFGRAIASHLSLPPNVSLLLGLGLKEHDPHIILPLLKELEQFKLWAPHNEQTTAENITVS